MRTVFRDAEPADDAELTRLVATPLPGALSLAFTREPSYLASCASCGPPRRVLTAVADDRVVALCSYFRRDYLWNGEPRSIWTVSDFRAAPDAAAKSITGRGWTALRERLGDAPALVSLLHDNPRASKLFSKPRPGWPTLVPVGDLCTNLSPLFPSWRRSSQESTLTTRRLEAWEIVAYTNGLPRSPLSPLIAESDFGSVLPPSGHFWGVFDQDRVLGLAGLWRQEEFRQVRIHSYGGWYRAGYTLGEMLRLPLLPAPRSEVPLSYASLLHCPRKDAFRALFARLKKQARADGSRFLVWCREGPEACKPLDRLRFRYHSSLYQLVWSGDRPLPPLQGPLGFEVAWL